MVTKHKYLNSTEELKDLISSGEPFIFLGSKTSTVIPYSSLEGVDLGLIVESSKLKCILNIDNEGVLSVSGAVNWQEAQSFCQSRSRAIMTSPTEELAQLLSGVATSCTGERCFGFGTLRDQVEEIVFIDNQGQQKCLSSDKLLQNHEIFQSDEATKLLKEYQRSYIPYSNYKNAPFPRLEKETDLMVGTEGQLGIVVEGKFETTIPEAVVYLFCALPKWEANDEVHLDIYKKVQDFREEILSCELIDENSWSYLDPDEIPAKGMDTIFLEVRESMLEKVYEEFLEKIEGIDSENIFSMPSAKCQALRMKIPRAIFEHNSQMGVVKKGTDVQATGLNFKKLLSLYRSMAQEGIDYNLFGHFGDAHLHFNFMPKVTQVEQCSKLLDKFYRDVLLIGGSPFAEHGIGLLKQAYIRPFWSNIQYEMFNYLKNKMDPNGIFFPQGYMGLKPLLES